MEERYSHVKYYNLRVCVHNLDEIPAQRIIDAIFLRRADFRVSAAGAWISSSRFVGSLELEANFPLDHLSAVPASA